MYHTRSQGAEAVPAQAVPAQERPEKRAREGDDSAGNSPKRTRAIANSPSSHTAVSGAVAVQVTHVQPQAITPVPPGIQATAGVPSAGSTVSLPATAFANSTDSTNSRGTSGSSNSASTVGSEGEETIRRLVL